VSETQQGPAEKYVAWRVVPYLGGCNPRRKSLSDIYTDRDVAIRAAKAVDGEDNWMISGLTQEQYERETRP
jgi:hypothetical protein